ncbi:MAG: 3-dehydroquinate synthase [Myxococcota bacterium]|nr:3-dehydroquinate synthase [Myxococcota bacterium]
MTVQLGQRSYPIHLLDGLPHDVLRDVASGQRAGRAGMKALLVTDSNVGPLYGAGAISALEEAGYEVLAYTLEAGEGSKSLDTISDLVDFALDGELKRGDLVVALGGGVVGDIAGFTASILHRGMSFLQVPTTLLAQVDSAVGGKTGVNHRTGKNLIGAFWQPVGVISSQAVLQTLPDRERRCGLAEAIKHGYIADADLVQWCLTHAEDLRALEPSALRRLVRRCCEIKAAVVQADERESGHRAILNFGHTLGHAYERILGFGALSHGEAVGLGMIAAIRLSAHLGLAPTEMVQGVISALRLLGLPTEPPTRIDAQDLIQAARTDKKSEGDGVRFVVLRGLGSPEVRRLSWQEVEVGVFAGDI